MMHVPRAMRRDYDLAKAYLCRDSSERAIFRTVERSPREFTLHRERRGNDRFDPAANAVWWDPYSALRTSRGGRQSPALGLGHELAHAAEPPARERILNARVLRGYDTLEERRVIRGSEAHAARTLREGVRTDHRGSLYRVATPVSR